MISNLVKNKNVLIIGAIVVALLFGFYAFSGGGGNVPAVSEVAVNPEEELIGRNLLSSLEKMKSVKLDSGIFGDSAFVGLKDFSVEISKQPVGRRNPFAPFAGQSSGPTKTPPTGP